MSRQILNMTVQPFYFIGSGEIPRMNPISKHDILQETVVWGLVSSSVMRHFDSSYRSLVNYRWAEVTLGDSTVKGGKDAVLPKYDHVSICVVCTCMHTAIGLQDIFILVFLLDSDHLALFPRNIQSLAPWWQPCDATMIAPGLLLHRLLGADVVSMSVSWNLLCISSFRLGS